MDTRRLTLLLAAAFIVHAISAVAAFIWFTMRRIEDSLVANIVGGLLLTVAVVTPYALFAWASYIATVTWAAAPVLLACAAAGGLALFAYSGAFATTDGEYVFVFLFGTAAQAIFAVVTLMVAYLARKRAEAL